MQRTGWLAMLLTVLVFPAKAEPIVLECKWTEMTVDAAGKSLSNPLTQDFLIDFRKKTAESRSAPGITHKLFEMDTSIIWLMWFPKRVFGFHIDRFSGVLRVTDQDINSGKMNEHWGTCQTVRRKF